MLRKQIIKALLTPQALIPLLCVIYLGFRGLQSLSPPPLVKTTINFDNQSSTELTSKNIELVFYDEEQLERPSIVTLELEFALEKQVERILQELKQQSNVWPDALLTSATYSAGLNNSNSIVIDFTWDTVLNLSVNDEWRLLKSIVTTLKRNGFNDLKILSNHQERPVFLNFIKQESVLTD